MKKPLLALTLTLTLFAANAENIMNNNPFYSPEQGHFYGITQVQTDSKANFRSFGTAQEIGYGITDKLQVWVATGGSFDFHKNAEDRAAWDFLNVGLSTWTEVFDDWEFVLDGSIEQSYNDGSVTAHQYNVTVMFGYATYKLTLAGVTEYNHIKGRGQYLNVNLWAFGLAGQYVINDSWNITADAKYWFIDDNDEVNAKVGLNYNFDATKFIGAHVRKSLWTKNDDDKSRFEYGITFGIDF
jgi:hypothetical protein